MIHELAAIGNPPEHRDYESGKPCWFPSIDETAKVNAFVTVDSGLREPTRVGARCFLMAHVHIGHDAQIGPDCELAPGTVIGGHAKIGKGVKFGVNACVKPFVTIGDGARIGMGAVVTKDVPAGEIWVGNPARNIEERKQFSEASSAWEAWWELSRA